MRKATLLILSTAALFTLAHAADWDGAWKPFRASYIIFSGELNERDAPTPTERTMAIALEGKAAREVFNSIGPDLRQTCSQEKGDRARRKEGIDCMFSPAGAAKGYRCWIGLNLRDGKTTPVIGC